MATVARTLAAMRGHRVYFDTNVFIYFLERDERYFETCLPFFRAVEDGEIIGVSGELAIAELLVKPMQTNDAINEKNVWALFESEGGFQALPHGMETLELAARIRATQKLAMIDAIHVATAINAHCSHIITNDARVSSRTKGIEVVRLEAL
jgi:predicted nucleic acid-binding protein